MEWIKITDNLPDTPNIISDYLICSDKVLVTDGNDIDIGNFCKRTPVLPPHSFWDLAENEYGECIIRLNKITHWMILPKLP